MPRVHEILVRKLREHSRLSAEDIAEIRAFSYSVRTLLPNEDFIRQGDVPEVCAVVVSGVVARYHLRRNGGRQYLSFHMAGDMPDAQALFLDRMDHAVSAIGQATVAAIPHSEVERAFEQRPSVGFAIWRETLIDAAIFREAITNNSARSITVRMAHFFCEIFYRARATNLVVGDTFEFPISLRQLGETLGFAIASINRSLQELRNMRVLEFRNGQIQIKNWSKLKEFGEFDPAYLHLRKPPIAAK